MKKIINMTLLLVLIILFSGCNIIKENDNMVSSVSGNLQKKEENEDTNIKENGKQKKEENKKAEEKKKKIEKKEEIKKTKKSNLKGTWPNGALANSITKPSNGFVRTFIEEKNACAIYVEMTRNECKDYVKEASEDGFDYDKDTYRNFLNGEGNTIQFGKDDGSGFSLSYANGLLTVTIFGKAM